MNTFNSIFGISDLIILIFLVLFYILFRKYIHNTLTDNPKLFEFGLFIWFVGNVLFVLLFTFYYGNGDTFNYYRFAKFINNYIINNPYNAFNIYFANNFLEVENLFYNFPIEQENYQLFYHDSNFFLSKVVSLFLFLTFDSYLATSLILTFASFVGCWLIFSALRVKYPLIKKELAISILFLPNLIFWGNGISKESVYLFGTGIFFSSLYKSYKTKFTIKNALLILFGSYLIYSIKSYILFIFIISFSICFLMNLLKNKSFSQILLTLSFTLCLSLFISLFLKSILESYLIRFASDNIFESIQSYGTQIHNLSELEGGSSYSLSEYEPSFWGLFKIFPEAISTALFRPYPWEVNKIINLFNSIEGSLIFFLVLSLVIKTRPIYLLKIIISNSDILLCLFFSIPFLFIMSLSSLNFGALVRYKLPGEIFFLIALSLIHHDKKYK